MFFEFRSLLSLWSYSLMWHSRAALRNHINLVVTKCTDNYIHVYGHNLWQSLFWSSSMWALQLSPIAPYFTSASKFITKCFAAVQSRYVLNWTLLLVCCDVPVIGIVISCCCLKTSKFEVQFCILWRVCILVCVSICVCALLSVHFSVCPCIDEH